jgi:hypothetical protein
MNMTKQELIEKIKNTRHELLYKATVDNVTKKGGDLISNAQTRDTRETYSNIIAEYLLADTNYLNAIQQVDRLQSYRIKDHSELTKDERNFLRKKERGEEWAARSFLWRTFDDDNAFGTFIDYQVPIKGVKADDAGKIDLLSYNKKHNSFYVIEFKREYNTEPLLRAVIQIYTYWKQINREKLSQDYLSLFSEKPKLFVDAAPQQADVRPAVLVYEGSRQYEQALNGGEVIELSRTLGVSINFVGFQIKAIVPGL